jgi:hypothetical protein
VPGRDDFERLFEKELAAGLALPDLPLPPDDPAASEP